MVSHDSQVFSKDDTACNGEVAVTTSITSGVPLMLMLFGLRAVVLPICGGLLHVPTLAADAMLASKLSFGVSPSSHPPSSSHARVAGGIANTIQFPPISLNGFGNALPTLYGQKHIAIPRPSVNVGAIYNLNCDHGKGGTVFTLNPKNPSH